MTIMKKKSLILAISVLLASCNHEAEQKEESSPRLAESKEMVTEMATISENFKIEDIEVSSADIGDFPFLNLPTGLQAANVLEKNFDVCFFPLDGRMVPFEGRLYKANVVASQGEDYSKRYFEKSIEEYLLAIGAVKVFDGEITKEEYERYHRKDPNKGGAGDMGYWDQHIHFYVVRSKDNGNIYIQYTSNNAGGQLNILQETVFEQTITKITSDKIADDLAEKGKAILYINFDTDKSNLTAEGKEVVKEITAALHKDKSIKISIDGHTDNTGDATHNKRLSRDRAEAVMDHIILDGISQDRLIAKGFGSDRPLFSNDTEQNKAKNRRVELVKIN